jgi:serine/threonine-protein kinase RsbW
MAPPDSPNGASPSRERRLIRDDRAEIESAERALVEHVESHGYPQAAVFAVRLAFEEAVVNALRHGHRDIPHEPVEVEWSVDEQEVSLSVRDKGPGFQPGDVPDPTAEENIEAPSGRGIMLMRHYMTRVEYNETGNLVRMVYERTEIESG